jgi:hypothetical protein
MEIKGEHITIFDVTLTLGEARAVYQALLYYEEHKGTDGIISKLTTGFGHELEKENCLSWARKKQEGVKECIKA